MKCAFSLIGLLLLSATPNWAQSAAPKCDGDVVIVSVYQIKAGGTMDGLLAAVAANQAWYRTNGISENQIVASRVIVMDDASGGTKYSDTEVLTYHLRPPSEERTPEMGDSFWKAFEKQYDNNAEKKPNTPRACPSFPGDFQSIDINGEEIESPSSCNKTLKAKNGRAVILSEAKNPS